MYERLAVCRRPDGKSASLPLAYDEVVLCRQLGKQVGGLVLQTLVLQVYSIGIEQGNDGVDDDEVDDELIDQDYEDFYEEIKGQKEKDTIILGEDI